MEDHQKGVIIIAAIIPAILLLLLCCLFRCFRAKAAGIRVREKSVEEGGFGYECGSEEEDLIGFAGGEELTVHEILDAPGEVVGKSSYGTLYRAGFAKAGSVMLLRFVRPACVARNDEVQFLPAVRSIGSVRHPNLVPLTALYVGPRGEKLFVHPFYDAGNLAQFLKGGKAESHRWEIIHKLSLGIARGLDHLHNGLHKPIVHGNLKSKNILLDADHQPRLSDFGLHLLLNPTTAQEMLEASAAQCYKAPELIKMKDACKETDVYSLGVIFLEVLTRKEPTSLHLPASLKNLFLEHKVSETFGSDVVDQSRSKNQDMEDILLRFFHLAMACCSPSAVLRPDIKTIVRKLEEL